MSLTEGLHEFYFFFTGHRVMASIRAIILSVLELLLPSSVKATENTTGCGIQNFLGYFAETMIEDFYNVAFGQIVTMAVSEHFLHMKPSIGRATTWSAATWVHTIGLSKIKEYSKKVTEVIDVKNWRIWDNEDVHDLGSIETEFPAIVFNDMLTSKSALSCELRVSSLNNDEINFRISFDESDDEDYTVIFDKNSFSYKIKTDSENDNDKVNMPSLPSPEPTVSYFDDLDFFKDFENEFPAIVYNNAQTSKLDLLTEPILSPQYIDEFDLKVETSLSECDKEEQNVLNFNDLFPFNVIYPNDSKSDKDNDDDKVDIEHSSRDLSVKPLPDVINIDDGAYAHGSNKLLETSHDTCKLKLLSRN
ncbi:hypothetical protein Tco_0644681 [Tanacetum coccineum]